jgi:ribonuclease HII
MTRPFQLIAGTDEVGRGPVAGSVFAAAVILDGSVPPIAGLADSKTLSAARRSDLFAQIRNRALCWTVAAATVEEIERYNILGATLLAMRRAVAALRPQPEFVWVDGNRLPDWHYASKAVVRGDQKVAEISAASIVAKVCRDRYMKRMSQHYPGYEFDRHAGYPTPRHLELLRQLGPSPIHRRSFAPVRDILREFPATEGA